MVSGEKLRSFQLEYGKYLRDPENSVLPEGIPARRSEIYEGLLFNNVSGFINNCFPVARSLYEEAQWTKLSRSFFRDWRCTSPLFSQIPYEFVKYVSAHEDSLILAPWIPELLHYEWIELEVDTEDTGEFIELAEGEVAANPSLKVLAYQWPVHKISDDFKPDEPEQTCLAIYRNSEFKVRFVELNATTFLLLQFIQQAPGQLSAILEQFAQQIKHPDPQAIITFGAQLVDDFIGQEILLGGTE